jgi:hypothetical protein
MPFRQRLRRVLSKLTPQRRRAGSEDLTAQSGSYQSHRTESSPTLPPIADFGLQIGTSPLSPLERPSAPGPDQTSPRYYTGSSQDEERILEENGQHLGLIVPKRSLSNGSSSSSDYSNHCKSLDSQFAKLPRQ